MYPAFPSFFRFSVLDLTKERVWCKLRASVGALLSHRLRGGWFTLKQGEEIEQPGNQATKMRAETDGGHRPPVPAVADGCFRTGKAQAVERAGKVVLRGRIPEDAALPRRGTGPGIAANGDLGNRGAREFPDHNI